MMKKILITLLLTAGISASRSQIMAQQVNDSLMHYIGIAVKNNPTVRQNLSLYKATLDRKEQAGSLPDPELSAGVLLKPMLLMDGRQYADIRVMQMFPWFGYRKTAREEMEYMAQAGNLKYSDAVLSVIADLEKNWLELYSVRKMQSITKRNIETLSAIEKLAVTGYTNSQNSENGQGLAAINMIKIERGELLIDLSELGEKEHTLTARINSLMNRDQAADVFVPGSIQADSLDLKSVYKADSLVNNNPMIKMLEQEGRSLAARQTMIKKMGLPMLGLGLNYTVIGKSEFTSSSMNGKDMVMPMLTLTLPVYRKKYSAMLSENENLRNANAYNRTEVENSLRTELAAAMEQYHNAVRRFQLYNNQNDLGGNTLEIMMQSFAAGKTSMTELLRIRQQCYQYETKKEQALADLNSAVADIRRILAISDITGKN